MCSYQQPRKSSYLQFTAKDAFAEILPTTFSATQMYSPSSLGRTFSICNELSFWIDTRPIGSFPSSRLHITLGAGSPSTTHLNVTLCPASASTSCGSFLKKGFTEINAIYINKKNNFFCNCNKKLTDKTI